MSLPRNKMHGISSGQLLCADCSASDPTWAVLNRGILICSDCCNVHRSLGRHISQIRSLKKGSWHTSQLSLMYTLANNGANNIWEHALLDPQGAAKLRHKPTPRDPVYPTKADFIRAKYANLSFALRPNKDEGPLNVNDLNRQLWSCVRTGHVETTLRLLALGANPNYFDPQKGTSPMMVSAKEGQGLQIELLTIYGGDPAQPDFSGFSPAEAARAEGHPDLANRLDELQFETTDRLTQYLCGRKPEHSSGQHFVIPEMASGQGAPGMEHPQAATVAKIAKRRLMGLPHSTFEKLIQDMYDEVDRRETDSAWLASMSHQEALVVNERYIVPFLPVNPDFSATRNQSRQKLAKFNAREFAGLIIDVLSEAKRRYLTDIGELPEKNGIDNSTNFDANLTTTTTPDYDSVPTMESPLDGIRGSVESPVAGRQEKTSVDSSGLRSSTKSGTSESDKGGGGGDAHRRKDSNNSNDDLVTLEDYLELKVQLGASEAQVETLVQSNVEIKKDLKQLHHSLETLMRENRELKQHMERQIVRGGAWPLKETNGPMNAKEDDVWVRATNSSLNGAESQSGGGMKFAVVSAPAKPSPLKKQESNSAPNSMHFQSPGGNLSNFAEPANGFSTGHNELSVKPVSKALASSTSSISTKVKTIGTKSAAVDGGNFPDNLVLKTESLTQEIQKLLADAEAGRHSSYARRAARIQTHIDAMYGLIPARFKGGSPIDRCLNSMVDSCITLTVQCAKDTREATPGVQEQLSCQVVQAAFEVAKGAKHLMLLIQKN